MSSSAHSALASLTATYTDSEDEDAIIDEDSNSNVQIIERPSRPNSATSFLGENSQDVSSGGGESIKSGGGGSRVPTASSLGLVSYTDDLIDDEAVDDHYTSDSNTAMDVEESQEDSEEKIAAADSKTDSESVPNGVEDAELVNVEEENSNSSTQRKTRIPLEPQGKCSVELQDKINKLYEKKVKSGMDMNLAIQRNKNFRNPSIYEKLIKYCDIDEYGSNYPRDVFDPHEWHASSYYDELAKAQKAEMERREKERRERTKVDFVSGTVKKPPIPPGVAQAIEAEPRRKSKWDQRGVVPPVMMTLPAPTAQAPLVQPPFINSASGTKSTVISAFGSINKKSK